MTVIERLIPSVAARQGPAQREFAGFGDSLRQRLFSALPIVTCAAAFAFVAALIVAV